MRSLDKTKAKKNNPRGDFMSKTFKCIGVTQNGDKHYLFNKKSFATNSQMNTQLNNAQNKNLLSPYTKLIIEITEMFSTFPNTYIWPEGQVSLMEFDIINGKVKKCLTTPRHQESTNKPSTKKISFSYQEKYAVGINPALKHLPKNAAINEFIKQLQTLNFNNLNCVILNRQIIHIDNSNVYNTEIMLYNPQYMIDNNNVIIGSKYTQKPTTRYISKRDLPITKQIITDWIENPENISLKLSNFFMKQK